jgi:hypothetical protein
MSLLSNVLLCSSTAFLIKPITVKYKIIFSDMKICSGSYRAWWSVLILNIIQHQKIFIFLMTGTLIVYHRPMRPVKTFEIYIAVLIMSNHKSSNSNKEGVQSVFHNFCPGLPVSLTIQHFNIERNVVFYAMKHKV